MLLSLPDSKYRVKYIHLDHSEVLELVTEDDKNYLYWPDVHQAMMKIKPECDHAEKRVIWKLQTYEYACRDCETVFSYDDLRKTIDDAQKDKKG